MEIVWEKRKRKEGERKKLSIDSNRSNWLHNIFLEKELAGKVGGEKKWKGRGSRTNCGNKLISGGRNVEARGKGAWRRRREGRGSKLDN